jgi:hypothetical protein
MKKPHFVIALLSLLTCQFGYAQTKVTLKYDPDKKIITVVNPNQRYLTKGNYIFEITGVNDAYHTMKFTAEFLDKVSNIPATLFPSITTTASQHNEPFLLLYTSPKNLKAAGNPWEETVDSIANDFAFIHQVVKSSVYLVQFLNSANNWKNVGICQKEAASELIKINGSLGALNNGVAINNLDKLKIVVQYAVNDFISRVQLIRMRPDFIRGIDPTQLTEIINREAFVKDNRKEIESCSDIIKAIFDCKDIISTKTYYVNSDYFRLDISLLNNRFTDKPDTALKQKITFYRKNYVKFVDVSSGFFFNNLYSRSYYFKDTLGHAGAENKSKSDFAIGALVNFYYVVSGDFKTGPSLGAAVSALDTKTKYIGGWSFIVGRRQEFVFSLGVSMASLPVPSNVLRNGQAFNSANSTGTVPTYNSITWGYFFGISYSLVKF